MLEEHNAVWFKANLPASAFEAALTSALAHWVPEHVLEPLAVDVDHGWSQLPHGGELFRDVLNRSPAEPRVWEGSLRQYASMQRALIPHTQEIELLGVPSARTTALPEVFDRVIAENTTLQPDDLKRLYELRPRLVNWRTELTDVASQTPSINPEPGRFTVFDWGDAAVSHPFCSFLVPARAAGTRYGAEVLPRLRDAYLEPWTGGGRTSAELRRAVTLAWRLSALGRACSWGRLFPGATTTTGAAESANWLLQLFTETPI
jgi:hypothetical protein